MIYIFRAHKGGVAQTGCSHLEYTQVTFADTFENDGNYFDVATSTYRPLASGILWMASGVWGQAQCAAPFTAPGAAYNFCAKIIKNGSVADPDGTKDMAQPGWVPAGYANTAGSAPVFAGRVKWGDFFTLNIYATSIDGANDVVIDGNPAHTWWVGMLFAE